MVNFKLSENAKSELINVTSVELRKQSESVRGIESIISQTLGRCYKNSWKARSFTEFIYFLKRK